MPISMSFFFHLSVYIPFIGTSFAVFQNQTIHIHRLWVPASERIPLPRVLHLQFHGREIHSLCLISVGMVLHSNEDANHFLRLSWIATGCEDGTVRLTRYFLYALHFEMLYLTSLECNWTALLKQRFGFEISM